MEDDSKLFDELIDCQLSSVELEKQLVIDFADKSQIVISLLPEDYTCPEAIYAHGFKDNDWIVY